MEKFFFKFLQTSLVLVLFSLPVVAETLGEGYEIKIKLSDYTKDTLFLGYQLGNQNSIYIRDTAVLDKSSGFFTFKGAEKLKPGIYLVAMPPDFSLQIVVSEQEQNFTLVTSAEKPYNKATLKNSKDNDIFFNYMHYLSDKSKEAEAAKILIPKDSVKAFQVLKNLDREVKTYQHDLITRNVGTVTATLIKTTLEIDNPNLDNIKDKNKRDLATYYHYKQHWFDNFEMNNPALLRMSTLFQRIDYYIEKLTPQHPDSINQSLDRIFELVMPNKETFQFYFMHYFNKYVQSKIVSYDAITVHLAKKYIETGQTDDFLGKDNRTKLVDNANRLFPILIGKKAPEITVFIQDSVFNNNSTPVSLYSVKSKYTVLFFYSPHCPHCQKQSPELVAFTKKAKEKNIDVKVFTTCTNNGMNGNTMSECWKYTQEKGFGDFINTMDPYSISRYTQLYNIETTPQLFLLDENKIIRSKNIDAKQLTDVLDFIIQEDNQKLKDGLKKD